MTRSVQTSMFPDLRAHRAVGPLVPSVIAGDNADLMRKIRHLYLEGRRVVDVTYGKGSWWRTYRPDGLTCHDLALDGVDFRHLPYPDGYWQTVCFDPPYIPAGGDTTSTAGEFQDSYGITGGRSQRELEALIFGGLAEAARVTDRTDGFLLVKCQDYVTSGAFTPMSYRIFTEAQRLGLHLHDEIVHNAGSGPGGHNIVVQRRARRHHSKLLVFTWEPR